MKNWNIYYANKYGYLHKPSTKYPDIKFKTI